MSEADHKRPRRRAAGWLLAGILLLALCGAMAAFQASTAGSAASVVPNPRGQPFGSLSAAAVSAMASNESPTAADAEGVDWDYWRVVNPAIVAWVSVDGTAIDYAVVQAPGGDPDYYLSHDIYRSWNPYGCPYVDAACDGVGGMSAVVFGHNMGGGFVAMFADFARYSDEAFARSHPTIELQTPNGAMELSVSAAQAFLKLGIASTVLVGALLLASGELEFMVYFCFLLVVTRFYDPINTVLEVVTELLNLKLGIKRMHSIEHERPQTGSMEFEPANHDISFDNVTFSYEGGEKVLSNVSFVAKEGEVTALVGPSGGGKSTAAKLAARFWDTDDGVVSIGGVDVSTVDPEALLVDFAQVFQDVVLFDDTIMQNIRLGRPDATDEEVFAAARAANCDDFVSRMPKGYETRIGENGALLSGGERQRISIARAILKNAPIVLLDEATASLDVENETKVQEALSCLLERKTVLVIAHRMRTVMSADKIVVLDGGRVAEQGKPSELMEREDSLFKKMVELQSSTGRILN